MWIFISKKGLIVYFLYGMRHSKENAQNGTSKIFPLKDINMEEKSNLENN